MASRRASVASTGPHSVRKYSTHRDQRQAELSLVIEEGRSRRPARLSEVRAVNTAWADFKFTHDNSDDLPDSLTRANTLQQSPLDVFHPGTRIPGPRRLTIKDVGGSFVKPFSEPNAVQQERIQQRFAQAEPSKAEIFDPESAQSQSQRQGADSEHEKSFLLRLYHRLRRQPGAQPAAFNSLEFVPSLPTTHANAFLSRARDPSEEPRTIYVFEYKFEADRKISCALPVPFESVEALKRHLKQEVSPVLRFIYTCNHDDAMYFLSSEYGISNASSEYGDRNFPGWLYEERDSRRAHNKAVRWQPAVDTARKVISTAFAVDFGAVLLPDTHLSKTGSLPSLRSRERVSESSHCQRIGVYLQRPITSKDSIPQCSRFSTGSKSLHSFANLPTIIVCESASASVGGAVAIGAPLLGLNITSRPTDPPHEAFNHAFEGLLLYILDGIRGLWKEQLELLHEPHAELEDYIWSQPANSSRAREVWSMSQRLQTMLKHVSRHGKVIEAVRNDFQVFSEREEEQQWLNSTLEDFQHLAETIRVDYREPLEHMVDLMYKSVAIRDARQSLEFNASLWRLSWVTFVFLPLTFLSGFFGMNVRLFSSPLPSISWYFVAAVPLLILVFAFWFGFRSYGPGSGLTTEEYSREELHQAGVHVKKPRTGSL